MDYQRIARITGVRILDSLGVPRVSESNPLSARRHRIIMPTMALRRFSAVIGM